MKKVNLLLAAVVAASVSAPALAEYTPNAHFYGFARAGVSSQHYNVDDPEKARLGRLGYESDIYGEVGLGTTVAKVDDSEWNINSRVAYKSTLNKDWQTADNTNSTEHANFAFRELYFDVKGFFDSDKDAVIWAGKRYYHREDIYINDWRYYDISGMGTGIENLSLGSGKLSLAWIRRDENRDYKWDETSKVVLEDDEKLDKTYSGYGAVHFLDAQYDFPVWDKASMELRATYMINQHDNAKFLQYGYVAKNEVGNGTRFEVKLNQGFSSGWNTTAVIFDFGSHTGSAGFGTGSWCDSSGAANSAHGISLFNYGDFKITDRFGIMHSIYFARSGGYDDNVNGENFIGKVLADDKNKGVTANSGYKAFMFAIHPYYQLTKMTKLVLEGSFYTETWSKVGKKDGVVKNFDENQKGQKLTLAYVLSPDASNIWSKPEIRLFATYLHSNENGIDFSNGFGAKEATIVYKNGYKREATKNHNNVIFGVYGEAWW